MSDVSTIKSWLRLPSTQRTLALCALIIVILFRMYLQERNRNDSFRDRSESENKIHNKECDEKIRVRDSIIAAKNSELQYVYKTQADEYKKARQEVEEIRENSRTIQKKAEKLVRDK